MKVYKGKSVLPSIAIGKLFVLKKEENKIIRKTVSNPEGEIERYVIAKDIARKQLAELQRETLENVGAEQAAIFEVHQMMLDDLDFSEAIVDFIRANKSNAEYAVSVVSKNFSEEFASMDDEYMKERAVDVIDISERVISLLLNNDRGQACFDEPVIIFADDLTPSETVMLDRDKVLAFVTRFGSLNSHTAILARTMNIPALVSMDIDNIDELQDKLTIVDGYTGCLYIEPDIETLENFKSKQQYDLDQKNLLLTYKDKKTITPDGRQIHLYANIGRESDVYYALENGAEGIGLYRSEFLYLENTSCPNEEQQYNAYKSVLEAMGGKRVIIRTMDIGADKKVEYLNLDKEENPALGYRAIRICLKEPDLFKTQLRALYRASVHGSLSIMIPMIISVNEVIRVKEIIEEVKCQLHDENIPFNEVEIGIMIETPAAVMISNELAKEVDFFSIGTNDLTQYTLAIDRQNPKLDSFYDSHHPAILEMIRITAQNAHKNNIWVGICGELAADTKLTHTFLDMGIDELSVSPSSILPLRKVICD